MIHSKDEVLKVANTLSKKLIELEADVNKELGFDGKNCEELKYRLADIVAMARMVTCDLGDHPFEEPNEDKSFT